MEQDTFHDLFVFFFILHILYSNNNISKGETNGQKTS